MAPGFRSLLYRQTYWEMIIGSCLRNHQDRFLFSLFIKSDELSRMIHKVEMEDKFMEVFRDFPRDTIMKLCARYCSRLEAMLEADGNNLGILSSPNQNLVGVLMF